MTLVALALLVTAQAASTDDFEAFDALAGIEPSCPTTAFGVWWQLVDAGLSPSADDLSVPWPMAAEMVDRWLAAAFPAGRGVLVLGEAHRMAGTHNLLKELVRHSEVVDCVLLEHPAWHQDLITAFIAGAPCEESWGLAEQRTFDLDAPLCRRDLRYRMLRVAAEHATAVYAVDACYSCEPLRSLTSFEDGDIVGADPASFADVVLTGRNLFMADQIAALYAEERCGVSVLLTGRAHVRPPPGFVPHPTIDVGDAIRAHGIATLDWIVSDVNEEILGMRDPRPEAVRFTFRDGIPFAVFLE